MAASARGLACVVGWQVCGLLAVLGCDDDSTAAAARPSTPAGRESTPFAPGPYGGRPHELAGPFTVDTLAGRWDFQSSWDGQDSYFFLFARPGERLSDLLHQSSLLELLTASPPNVHYFFLTRGADADAHARTMRARAEKMLQRMGPSHAEAWLPRLHFVTTPVTALGGWLATLAAEMPLVGAIDRHQRVREAGLPAHLGVPRLAMLAHQARAFNFEHQRQRRLGAAEVVSIMASVAYPGGWGSSLDVTVDLQDAAFMSQFDTMEIDLTLACPDRLDAKCPEWDHMARLYLCDASDPSRCDTELARWVTPYRREGRWITDISPMLAHLRDGGPRVFRFATPQAYTVQLELRLQDRGTGMRPFLAVPLFTGGRFDAGYNARHAPITLEPPATFVKAEIFALVTGHGWGVEAANCAEFCAHSHHFEVNGVGFAKYHPEAGTSHGCVSQVDQGVIPNQWGSWPFGRAGWCPGMDVKPFVADITAALHEGANVVRYRGLLDGVDYVPEPVAQADGNGFPAEIELRSYVVYWQEAARLTP